MQITAAQLTRHRHLWWKAYLRVVPLGLLAVVGGGLAAYFGNMRHGSLDHRLLALAGVVLCVLAAVGCLHVLTTTARAVLKHYIGARRAATSQFFLRVAGYLVILFMALALLKIPVAKLLLGGAVTGIILGVAAQQALANFFASIIILITQPYSVGERVSLISGGLGGKHEGTIIDIGLTHTKLQPDEGDAVLLPNATLLSGAAIIRLKQQAGPK